MKIKTRKILVYSALMGAAFFTQACGSNNNSTPVCGAGLVAFGSSCIASGTSGGYPIGTGGSITSTNQTAFQEACGGGYGTYSVNTPSGVVQVCRVSSSVYSVDQGAALMSLNGSGSSVSASGGTNTGVVLAAGDKINIWSYGHYSISGQSGCSGAGPTSNGDTSSIGNNNSEFYPSGSSNSAGLWFAFEDASGVYESPTSATVQCSNTNCIQQENPQTVSVQGTNAGSSSTLNLMIGYNNANIKCGDMGMYYQIERCVDANGLTYPCN
jgi:hypothetical protein